MRPNAEVRSQDSCVKPLPSAVRLLASDKHTGDDGGVIGGPESVGQAAFGIGDQAVQLPTELLCRGLTLGLFADAYRPLSLKSMWISESTSTGLSFSR